MYGLRTPDRDRKTTVHAKKPTKFMTNSRALGQELSRQCDKSHVHQSLVDGRARSAARYPPALCRAICRGIIRVKKERHEAIRIVANICSDRKGKVPDPEEFHEREEADIPMHCLNKLTLQRTSKGDISSSLAYDDLTGMRLDAGEVIEARAKEVKYVKEKGVYSKITRKEAQARGWKIIKTRRIDIHKGDDTKTRVQE